MTRTEALAAVAIGRRIADEMLAGGCDLLGIGEMGIGNTTASSAIVAALTGRPAAAVTGRGTGLDDVGVARKAAIIDAALARHRLDPADPIGVLAAVGGFEIAGLVGAILATAGARVPVVLDTLGLEPVLDLGLRLGEGSGAALAIPVIRVAARIIGEMATFEDAGVTNRE